MRSIGINNLSSVVYVVCANTEVIFAAAISALVLKKAPNSYQVAAIFLVLGAVIFAVWDPDTGEFEGQDGKGDQDSMVLGILLTCFSRFLSAFNSILAEKTLGKNRKSPWGVHELPIAQALIPTFVLPATLLISKENTKQWPKLTAPGTPGVPLLAFILGSMAIVKLVVNVIVQ